MMLTVLVTLLAGVLALLVLSGAHPASSQTTGTPLGYTIEDIGTLGGPSTVAYGMNNFDQVVGTSSLSASDTSFYHAYLYDKTKGVQDLGTLPGKENSQANAINNSSGQVVGAASSADPFARGNRAFLYPDPQNSGKMKDLGALGGNESVAIDVNDLGQVVGWAETATLDDVAFFYDEANGMQGLGTLGGKWSTARDINNFGQVVGESEGGSPGSSHAFLYPDPQNSGKMKDLGTLAGSGTSWAAAINDSGQVAGSSTTSTNETHAFLYPDPQNSGKMKDLGTLGGSISYAYGMNNSGQTVGVSELTDGSRHAFLYRDGKMIDLNSRLPANSGWVLEVAYDINDNGSIVGWGTLKGQFPRAFLLAPQTPEEQIENLQKDLNALNLPLGTTTSLEAKLTDALNALQANDTTTACTALGDFINQVNAQAGKKISQSDADILIAAAKQIRTALGCQ